MASKVDAIRMELHFFGFLSTPIQINGVGTGGPMTPISINGVDADLHQWRRDAYLPQWRRLTTDADHF